MSSKNLYIGVVVGVGLLIFGILVLVASQKWATIPGISSWFESDSSSTSSTPSSSSTSSTSSTPSTSTKKVDCVYSWQPWSECTAQCGHGYQFRDPIIKIPAANGGKACPPPANRSNDCSASGNSADHCRDCNNGPCVPVDCNFSWTEWSTCSKPCGSGIQTRAPVIHSQPRNFGQACPSRNEVQACNESPCGGIGTTGWMKTSGTKTVPSSPFNEMKIELLGGGGNGGESEWSNQNSICAAGGGGGGSGAYFSKTIPYSPSMANATYTYSIGREGSTTSLTFQGQTYTAEGGKNGGNASGTTAGVGGAGGSPGGVRGNDGSPHGGKGCGGDGGSTQRYGGGDGGCGCCSTFRDKMGQGPGAGGGGASSNCGKTNATGYGAGGGVRITFS